MEAFLHEGNRIAVVGASRDTKKWGRRVYEHLKSEGFDVVPVNPHTSELAGETSYPDVTSIPGKVDVAVTIVPPEVTEQVVQECAAAGITKVWMQPGSESEAAVAFCEDNEIEVIHEACMVTDGLGQEFAEEEEE